MDFYDALQPLSVYANPLILELLAPHG